MNWHEFPPLNSLRAFLAVADAGSLSKAGESLNVSHAAVSQQIRNLESHLGTQLLSREGRGVTLTAKGRELAHELRQGFTQIFEAVVQISNDESLRPLQVSTTPLFAANWLMPRLADFRHAHPDVELMLNPTVSVVELSPGGVDLAVRFGDGNWPGLSSELLIATDFVVVATPDLIETHQIKDLSDLSKVPWLQETGTTEVQEWLNSNGILEGTPKDVMHLPGFMMLEAVRSGAGVLATTRSFVERDIRTGQLKLLFAENRDDKGYHLITQPGVMRPPLKTLVNWLRRQVPPQEI